MNNLHLIIAQVVGLRGKRIRCTHQGYLLLHLVDYNGLMTVVLIPDIILLPEDGRMLLSPRHMAKGFPINNKSREGCQ